MFEVRKTETFATWLDGLRDMQARAPFRPGLNASRWGNSGDVRPVGEAVSEMRIDYGPGYHVYYIKRGREPGDYAGRW